MRPLTVVTYNVHHAALDEKGRSWDRRRAPVARRLRQAQPDIICLQECAGQQHAELAAELPGYEWVCVADSPGTGEHNPIGYSTDLQLRGADTTWLSESGERGSVGWDGGYPRVLSRAQFSHRPTGLVFSAYNTHFDHLGARARFRSAGLVRDRVDSLPDERPAVVAGDFNAEPGTDAYQQLVCDEYDRQLLDARTDAARTAGPETTFTDFTTLKPDREVDHVFLSPEFDVASYTVDTTRAAEQFPSDHLPVVTEFSYAP
jgi:endonuclease/exonuclease/phosphatase family metal-dependent hydrolase